MPPPPSPDADPEAGGIRYRADPGSHTAQQGFQPEDFEFPADRRACQSTIRMAVNGCPGASPDGGRIDFICFFVTIPRAAWRQPGLSVSLPGTWEVSAKETDSGSPAQSRRHRPLQDSPATWVLCALSLMEVSAGVSFGSGSWRSLVGTPSSQAAPSPSSELCKGEPCPLREPLF